jgi:hypothetical protein
VNNYYVFLNKERHIVNRGYFYRLMRFQGIGFKEAVEQFVRSKCGVGDKKKVEIDVEENDEIPPPVISEKSPVKRRAPKAETKPESKPKKDIDYDSWSAKKVKEEVKKRGYRGSKTRKDELIPWLKQYDRKKG